MADDPTPAWTAWSSLSERTQLEVGHLARLGVRHPNDEVAEAAGAWASVLLSSAQHGRAGAWWDGVARGAVSAVVVDPWVIVEGAAERADERAWLAWAEQVLAANAGTAPLLAAPRPAGPTLRWSEDERRRQLVLLVPVMLAVVFVLVFLAVVATR